MLSTQESCVCSFNECIFCIKKQRHYFANKGLYSQSYSFSSSHVWTWQLDNKKAWVPKNYHFWTVGFKKTFESSLDFKEIKPVNPKGNQFWIFIGRTDAKAQTPILWPPDAKNWLIRKFKELTLWKRPWCRERLRVRGEGDDRGWDGWMASLTWWTWVWASSRIWWWTGKPGVLQSVGSQSWKWLSNWTELKVALNNRKVQKKTKNSLQFSIPSSFTETATQQEKDPNEPRPKQKISGITSHHHLRPRNLRSCSSIPSPWLQPKKVPVVLNQGRMAPVGAFGKVWFA